MSDALGEHLGEFVRELAFIPDGWISKYLSMLDPAISTWDRVNERARWAFMLAKAEKRPPGYDAEDWALYLLENKDAQSLVLRILSWAGSPLPWDEIRSLPASVRAWVNALYDVELQTQIEEAVQQEAHDQWCFMGGFQRGWHDLEGYANDLLDQQDAARRWRIEVQCYPASVALRWIQVGGR